MSFYFCQPVIPETIQDFPQKEIKAAEVNYSSIFVEIWEHFLFHSRDMMLEISRLSLIYKGNKNDVYKHIQRVTVEISRMHSRNEGLKFDMHKTARRKPINLPNKLFLLVMTLNYIRQ